MRVKRLPLPSLTVIPAKAGIHRGGVDAGHPFPLDGGRLGWGCHLIFPNLLKYTTPNTLTPNSKISIYANADFL